MQTIPSSTLQFAIFAQPGVLYFGTNVSYYTVADNVLNQLEWETRDERRQVFILGRSMSSATVEPYPTPWVHVSRFAHSDTDKLLKSCHGIFASAVPASLWCRELNTAIYPRPGRRPFAASFTPGMAEKRSSRTHGPQ